ncbi:unnamed protein product [Polarella glacialis]|uniref:Uncharacterized protein n=1 Tax=Polarella glacialis TaxID=89957 RepID=A0A813DRI9_POLGL|nr:unnamed protein product [Polarella glacialis]
MGFELRFALICFLGTWTSRSFGAEGDWSLSSFGTTATIATATTARTAATTTATTATDWSPSSFGVHRCFWHDVYVTNMRTVIVGMEAPLDSLEFCMWNCECAAHCQCTSHKYFSGEDFGTQHPELLKGLKTPSLMAEYAPAEEGVQFASLQFSVRLGWQLPQ